MKKLLLITMLYAIAISNLNAQIKTSKTLRNTQNLNLVIPPPPPPPPTISKTSDPISNTGVAASVYTLTSARVNIRTGNDNKEFPSKILVTLKTKATPISDWSPFYQLNLDNEMRINSNTEFGLERDVQLRGESKLEAFQNSGLIMRIIYLPNFFADAWKIENITLVLEFKNQFGNPHPTLGSKTIVFSNAYGFLNNEYRYMECITDGSFNPLTAVISKQQQ
ncbi:MAG: hypothetical protein Q8S41_12285 [Lutibacter sp.]|nr:hypothetical protein [Lutibacter sp.]